MKFHADISHFATEVYLHIVELLLGFYTRLDMPITAFIRIVAAATINLSLAWVRLLIEGGSVY